MQQTHISKFFEEINLHPVATFNGENFYDTRNVFDRHNFARDVKRNVPENCYMVQDKRYLLNEAGIVAFAFKKGISFLTDRFISILELPATPSAPFATCRQPQPIHTSSSSYPRKESEKQFNFDHLQFASDGTAWNGNEEKWEAPFQQTFEHFNFHIEVLETFPSNSSSSGRKELFRVDYEDTRALKRAKMTNAHGNMESSFLIS